MIEQLRRAFQQLRHRYVAIADSGDERRVGAVLQKAPHEICQQFPVAAVDITVHKPKAPIEVDFGDVSVSVHRSRQ